MADGPRGVVLPAVLSRGFNRRSPSDKAFLQWQGRALVDHVLAALVRLPGIPVVITKRPDAYAAIDADVVEDRHEAETPISGILTAEAVARERGVPWILVAGADTVPTQEGFFEALWEARPTDSRLAVLPVVAGALQPIPALYHLDAIHVWRRAFREHRYHLTPVARSLEAVHVSFPTAPYINVNAIHHLPGFQGTGA